MKISYLGPKGTYCYDACEMYTQNKDYEKISASSINEAIMMLKNDEVSRCIVPVENSIKGSVYETIDAIIENEDIYIIDEEVLEINHCLMTRKEYDIKDIQTVFSHVQALGQCYNFLKENIPNCKTMQVSSTAQGAEAVLENENSACIANKACAEIYGLNILDDCIQDKKNNKTKFLVLSKEKSNLNEHKKISVIFTTLDKPGALCNVLDIFRAFNINLTKIESKPTQNKLGEYIFWVDFEGNIENNLIDKITNIIKGECGYFRIIGMY